MLHYHGTPITPRATLMELAGRNFCVSFARPEDIKVAHQIGQSVMLDNGAFSVWRRGAEVDWAAWAAWAEEWTCCPTTWAVLPDVIDGSEDDNDRLLSEYDGIRNTVPVWHLHEGMGRLLRLVDDYGKVCFGSSGAFATIGTDGWHRRVSRAFDELDLAFGKVPWVHMLRGMALSGGPYPFASVDSTDVARNHNRPGNTAARMAARWDSLQCPHVWERRGEQLAIDHTTEGATA